MNELEKRVKRIREGMLKSLRKPSESPCEGCPIACPALHYNVDCMYNLEKHNMCEIWIKIKRGVE